MYYEISRILKIKHKFVLTNRVLTKSSVRTLHRI